MGWRRPTAVGEASDLLTCGRSERAAKALGLEIRQDEQEVVDPPQEAAPTLYSALPVRASR